ncbi:hypothetical protein SASPL_148056 [Salvia splendens]|uniref:Uncharacterized protein n=1 Tax=Salvia splendens TaxID=180675 RepID=A0A8X8W9Y1_SALSN|nr:hypothetical protein SASPL_148056 [Salvia splendens]
MGAELSRQTLSSLYSNELSPGIRTREGLLRNHVKEIKTLSASSMLVGVYHIFISSSSMFLSFLSSGFPLFSQLWIQAKAYTRLSYFTNIRYIINMFDDVLPQLHKLKIYIMSKFTLSVM